MKDNLVNSFDKNEESVMQKTSDAEIAGNNKTAIYIGISIMIVTILVCCLMVICAVVFVASIQDMESDNDKEGDTLRQQEIINDFEDVDRNIDDETQGDRGDNIPFEGRYDSAQVNIDDDPILGDIDTAEVVIVEFVDYECPFCQRHHENTFPLIVQNYIDSGDLALVSRNFPLTFHGPASTKKAMAAECVQDISNDEKYFEYQSILYNIESTSVYDDQSGSVVRIEVPTEELAKEAKNIGIEYEEIFECIESNKFESEVQDDMSDGLSVGVSGTPGFIIGMMDEDGDVEGFRLSGALPYNSFEEVIDYFLNLDDNRS